VDATIRKAVMRTLATGALLIAVVPPAAVLATQPRPVKSIVLKMSLEPSDDPRMATSAADPARAQR